MWNHVRPAVSMLLIWTAITGVAYPLLVTGIAQTVFPDQANGSLILKDNEAAGSALIGQSFSDPKYFWGRPSATAPVAYNAGASSGSNQGPTNPALTDAVAARIKTLREADPGNKSPIPVDLVTASASGLDPHISPAAVEYQIDRVAKARNLNPETVRELVARHTESRQFGVLGEPRVNVLKLNLALDAMRLALSDHEQAMKHDAGSVAMAALLQAGSAMAIVDRYALPRTKAYLEPCRKAALALHPGVEKEFRVLNRDDGFYFRFDIRESAGPTWAILCDGLTGKIIKEQRQDDF